MPQTLTRPAFDEYRKSRTVQAMSAEVKRYAGDTDRMTVDDGLASWTDGVATSTTSRPTAPQVGPKPDGMHLWIVSADDVVHAAETCEFGAGREFGKIKHSNLTGGADAFSGGELVFIDDQTLVLNGCSGRYRIRSEAEMSALASAFRRSGYRVWSMGWSTDTDRPAMFGLQDPEWVAS